MFEAIIYEGIEIIESGIVGGFDIRHAKDCKAELANRKLGIQMNKQIVLLTIFILLLNSCAPNATPNVTAASEVTDTPTFTSAPTFTPTITLTATETPDPNRPPDATGTDAQGNYTKVENGITVIWHPEFNEWMRTLNVNNAGIALYAMPQAGLNIGFKDQVFLFINVSDKLQGFAQIASISRHPSVDIFSNISFPNQFF